MTLHDAIPVCWFAAAQVAAGDDAAVLAAWLLGVLQRRGWGEA